MNPIKSDAGRIGRPPVDHGPKSPAVSYAVTTLVLAIHLASIGYSMKGIECGYRGNGARKSPERMTWVAEPQLSVLASRACLEHESYRRRGWIGSRRLRYQGLSLTATPTVMRRLSLVGHQLPGDEIVCFGKY